MDFSSSEELPYKEPTSSPETQTNPESYKVMPKSIAEDIIQLFPHSASDLVFDITPLAVVPP